MSIEDELKYIKIKDLKGRYFLNKTLDGEINVRDKWIDEKPSCPLYGSLEYDWKALKDDIKTNGIINPLSIIEKSSIVSDGNHRLAVAELLYPSDKKIPCTFYKNPNVSQEQIDMIREFHKNEDKSRLGPVNLKML